MRRCACHGRRFCVWCVVQTAAFPLEHLVWTRMPVLRIVGHWIMGAA